MQDIEIEIKVKVEHLNPLKEFLQQKAKLKTREHQVDEYFNSPGEDFLKTKPIKKWLRLRKTSKGNSFNYKYFHYKANNRADYCDELETEFTNYRQFKKILQALGFKQITVVDKKRESWDYQNYEISIDQVKNLGGFVEIEYKGRKNVVPSEETEGMVKFLKDLGCGKILRNYNGYPWLILFPDDVNTEER